MFVKKTKSTITLLLPTGKEYNVKIEAVINNYPPNGRWIDFRLKIN